MKEQIVHAGLPVSADIEDLAKIGERPNIVLICMDQLRADFLGVNGHPVCQTPHMDRLAAKGVNFRHSMSECPVCCPARRILMTGLDPFGVHMFQNRDLQPFPEGPKLAEVLSAGGYQTHGVGKMHTWPPRDRMGFGDIEINEEGRTAGHDYPDDYVQFVQEAGLGPQLNAHGMGNNQYGYRPSSVPEWATTTGWTADRAMRFLRRRDPSRPFFLYASFDKPHPPLTPPAEYYDLYRDTVFPEPVNGAWTDTKGHGYQDRRKKAPAFLGWDRTDGSIQQTLRAYAACVTHIDTRIGQLIGTLRETGVLANTWIMVVADHGDQTLDHGMLAKGRFLSAACCVPYILVPPKTANDALDASVVGRVDREHAVGLQDVMPTLLDLAGCELPATMTGRSVVPLLRDEEVEWRDMLFGVVGGKYGAHDGRYRYQWDGQTGEELLFDQLEDTKDLHDLSDDAAHADTKACLRAGLLDWLTRNDDIHVENGELITVPVRVVGDVAPVGFNNSPWNNRGWRG